MFPELHFVTNFCPLTYLNIKRECSIIFLINQQSCIQLLNRTKGYIITTKLLLYWGLIGIPPIGETTEDAYKMQRFSRSVVNRVTQGLSHTNTVRASMRSSHLRHHEKLLPQLIVLLSSIYMIVQRFTVPRADNFSDIY